MNMIKRRWLILILAMAGVSKSNCANIIFDLGDVLIETHYTNTLWSIGPLKMAYYASTWQNPFTIHLALFSFLESIKPRTEQDLIVKDAHGHVLPPLMWDWLKGMISSQDLLSLIRSSKGTFNNWQEEVLVRSLAETIFDPEVFVQTRSLVAQGVSFIHECKKAGHKIYVLSNWDPASFALLQEKYPDFFEVFDGIIVSGNVGMLKPDPAIYHHLLAEFNLNPHESYFIDDQEDNIAVAKALKINGILYRKKRGLLASYHNFDAIGQAIKEHLSLKDFVIPIY